MIPEFITYENLSIKTGSIASLQAKVEAKTQYGGHITGYRGEIIALVEGKTFTVFLANESSSQGVKEKLLSFFDYVGFKRPSL